MPITTTPSGGPQGEFSTYTPIYSTTLSATTASVTFSNIPTTYTDLVLVVQGTWAGTGYEALSLTFNGDTSSNYSRTLLNGTGTSALSSRESTANWGALGNDQSNSILHIMNYSNATTYKTIISRGNSASNQVRATVGLWRSTSPITSITTQMASNSYASGTTFTIYGIKAAAPAPKATGGDFVYTDNTYWYHVFNNSGVFDVKTAITADYLVVAGGGGGAGVPYDGAGGGGAGGLRSTVTNTGGLGTLESQLSLLPIQYSVLVGSGGGGGRQSNGISGNNSVFSTITSTGGGFGARLSDGGGNSPGGTGGSGGGAASGGGSSEAGVGGTRTASPVQGFAGGGVTPGAYLYWGAGGGGGGAGAAGTNGVTASQSPNSTAGNGGNGVAVSITGSSVTYAGGGGGATGYGSTGSAGSGGAGAGVRSATPPSATPNTGSGGGGNGNQQSTAIGGNGGSGIVVVRYAV
jgi:hypothetical protein